MYWTAVIALASSGGYTRVLPDVLFLHVSDEESSVRVDNPVVDKDRSIGDNVSFTKPPSIGGGVLQTVLDVSKAFKIGVHSYT